MKKVQMAEEEGCWFQEEHVDIHELFMYYNALYFKSTLESRVMVEWSSSRMTSCGGICRALPGGGIVIRLSKPLLCLRPSSDLKNVLLHEMIHAYMFVHRIRDDDAGGHGTMFKSMMQEINMSQKPDAFRPVPGGYAITVYHSMFAEVEYYKKHHWQCPQCGDVVKRAMNRKPQQADCRWYSSRPVGERHTDCRDVNCRWHMHEKYCGGMYLKTQGVDGKKKRMLPEGMQTIDSFVKVHGTNTKKKQDQEIDDQESDKQKNMKEEECIDLTELDHVVDLTDDFA